MTTETPDRPAPEFDRHMLEALVCPVTHATLHYDAARQELHAERPSQYAR